MTTSSIQVRWRALRYLVVAAIMLVLTGCPHPILQIGASSLGPLADSNHSISGIVEIPSRKVQATIDTDVAPGATVSLIEVDTGNTVGSTLTDANGRFLLTLSNTFRPRTNTLYYLEAVKGLGGGIGQANVVGEDAVRVRTIAKLSTGWQTLTNAAPVDSVTISPMTTALAIDVSLRKPTDRPIDASTLMGAIVHGVPQGGYPDTLNLPDTTLLPISMVQRTYDLVMDSLNKNRDPVRWIQLSTSDSLHNTVALPDAPFTVAYVSPDTQVPNGSIALVGSNFSSNLSSDAVWFTTDGGATVSAQVTAVSADLSRLTVTVPAAAINGPLYVSVSGKVLTGPRFQVAMLYGHSVIDATGDVYVVNKALGTVSVVEPLPGSTKTGVRALVTGLDNPGALTFGPNGYPDLFVGCGGNAKTVYRINLAATPPTPVAYTTGTGVANPSGIAFRDSTGDLYLSDAAANQLYVVASGSAAVQAVTLSGTALNQPRGLTFGPGGSLYVANSASNNVLAVSLSNATTGTATVFATGLSVPWGVAFDNRGNFYVSNNQGNSVYRMPVTSAPGVTPLTYGSLTSFASIPTPGGLNADPSGYIYVVDNGTNGVYRINSQAESRQIGYGISYPTSIVVDSSGKYILTELGRVLYLNTSGELSLLAEGLTSAIGLAKDSSGNLYTNQNGLQAITRIRPDGSTSMILTNMGNSNNAELHIVNDKLYVRSSVSFDPNGPTYPMQGEVLEYDLSNLAAGPTRRLRTLVRQATMIARDESGDAYNGMYYTVNASESTILRINRVSGSSVITPVITDSTHLKTPKDIWVDPSGHVWIADYTGTSGNGGLYVYGSDGTFLKDYSASVVHPTNLNSDHDGVGVYVNNPSNTGDIREISLTDGSILRTLSGFNQPWSFAFTDNRSTMFVNEVGLNRIATVANYASTPGAISSFFASSGTCNDIETLGTSLVTTNGGSLRQIQSNGVTVNNSYLWQWNANLNHIFKNSDGNLAYCSDGGVFFNSADGNLNSFAAGLNGGFGCPWPFSTRSLGSGLITSTDFVSYGGNSSGYLTTITDNRLDGSQQTAFSLNVGLGGMATNGTDEYYFTQQVAGTIYKLKAGTLTSFGGPYSSTDQCNGVAYYNGQLFQTIQTQHRIDQIDSSTGARTHLLIGLAAPEL